MKDANLALSFLLELAALVALGYWGFSTGNSLLMQLTLGLGAPILMMVVWGILLAPASQRRLPNPSRMVVELIIFGVAATGLADAGQLVLAVIFAVLVLLNMGLLILWKQ